MKIKEPTMRDKILSLLEQDPTHWHPSYDLIKVNTPKGWLGSSGDRIARYMAEDGTILKQNEGTYAEYKLKTEVTQLSL